MIRFRITADARQRFSVVLSGQRVVMDLWYAVALDRWSLDIEVDDRPRIRGRRIVPGIDLLAPFDLGIGALFCAASTGDAPDRHAFTDGRAALYHATREEADAAVAA